MLYEVITLPSGGETWDKVNHAQASVDAEGNVSLTFGKPEAVTAAKVHCLYDERDELDQALDAATFIQRSDCIRNNFV